VCFEKKIQVIRSLVVMETVVMQLLFWVVSSLAFLFVNCRHDKLILVDISHSVNAKVVL